jgi:hypothetical protein
MSVSEVLAAGATLLLFAPVAQAHGPSPAQPQAITVPPALQRLSTTLEPSGVVWAPTMERYLVVSDDTGTANNHHQPWLLAMTRAGAFDETPIPVLGVDEINDAESICAGPSGLFFLGTSHSLNRNGHASKARKMILLMRPEGRTLRVIGRIDLTTAQGPTGTSLLQIADLPVEGKLDIEAITFRDGALLVGLKSPLSVRNGAVIVRLEAAEAALRAGAIPPGGVTRWQEVALLGTPRKIPQGIADMTSLPDGSLLILANSPKGMPKDGGGGLYWLREKDKPPQLLHWFERLKPEGVTLTEDGKALILVFDNDDRPPQWMHWPLPRVGHT